jgi:hypothetical protein
MTLPRALSERLILVASFSRSPGSAVQGRRRQPPRSVQRPACGTPNARPVFRCSPVQGCAPRPLGTPTCGTGLALPLAASQVDQVELAHTNVAVLVVGWASGT